MKQNKNAEIEPNEQIIRTYYGGESNPKETRVHIPIKVCPKGFDILKFVGIAAIIIISIIAIMTAGAFLFAPHTPVPVAIISVPTPTPTPTTVPLETTNILTVTAMTESGGFPQIGVEEDDRCFWLSYNDYDNIHLGDRVRFTISGKHNLYNNIQYNVVEVRIVGHRYNGQLDYNRYPKYYDDGYDYYQYDGYRTDKVSWKQARGEKIIIGKPPHY